MHSQHDSLTFSFNCELFNYSTTLTLFGLGGGGGGRQNGPLWGFCEISQEQFNRSSPIFMILKTIIYFIFWNWKLGDILIIVDMVTIYQVIQNRLWCHNLPRKLASKLLCSRGSRREVRGNTDWVCFLRGSAFWKFIFFFSVSLFQSLESGKNLC